ncbi:multidrug resistance protein D [Legionella busanensis]|uniref:Multidrug resistance protein D n=1 Tax=Legionella busanensis TaxID=190655 RepID=A0A378JFZ5_9GAMM|nr:MFS transporter [Legionella busanensis]STX50196.1 multidrug resistance protein D [Legionella busanensis]
MSITISAPNKLIIFAIANGLIAQFAMDIYIPSMPALIQFFNTISDTIQLSYFYFMLGFGFSIFLNGWTNRGINYRHTFLICNSIFLLSTLLIIFSTNITYFLTLRFLQGIGAGFGSIAIIIALIHLLLPSNKLGIFVSYTVFFLTTANVIAPILGGYLQELYGWQSNFIFLFILAFLLLLSSYRFLPDITIAPKKEKKVFFKKMKILLKNKYYMMHMIYAIICVSIIVCYLIMSSFILQLQLGVSTRLFGWIGALISLLFSLGSLFNSILLVKYLPKNLIYIGLIISLLGTVNFLIASWFTAKSILAFVIPMAISSLGLGVLYPNFIARGFKNFNLFIIDATSLLSLMKIIVICLITVLVALIPDTFFSCALLIGLMYSLLLALILYLNREYLSN